MTIGLLSIVLNESEYISRFIENARRFPNIFDRALFIDGGSTDGTLDRLREYGATVIERPFENQFADQRNFGIEQLGTDWILELDADEIASSPLLGGLKALICDAEKANVDCVGLPRLNFIDGKLVESPGAKGLDFQYRLHRNICRWRGAVHEVITNYRARYELSLMEGHFILHDKTSKRHQERNGYYSTIRP